MVVFNPHSVLAQHGLMVLAAGRCSLPLAGTMHAAGSYRHVLGVCFAALRVMTCYAVIRVLLAAAGWKFWVPAASLNFYAVPLQYQVGGSTLCNGLPALI
jgi:hypothetical protein